MKKMKAAYGVSRTRDKKGAIVKQDLLDWVNCLHANCGGGWETMWILVFIDMGKYYRIRKLTARECFRFMGMRDSDVDKIKAAGISEGQQYKMAGNSIVVPVLEGIFTQMFRKDSESLF